MIFYQIKKLNLAIVQEEFNEKNYKLFNAYIFREVISNQKYIFKYIYKKKTKNNFLAAKLTKHIYLHTLFWNVTLFRIIVFCQMVAHCKWLVFS